MPLQNEKLLQRHIWVSLDPLYPRANAYFVSTRAILILYVV